MIDIENFRRDEIVFNNEKDFLNEINKNKLTLRKKKSIIKFKKRENILYYIITKIIILIKDYNFTLLILIHLIIQLKII